MRHFLVFSLTLFLLECVNGRANSLNPQLLVHGHRGTRGTRPENTLPAFQEAVSVGTDILEMDMQLSADDVIIVSHDPVIDDKCADSSGKKVVAPIPIRSLKASEIAQYDCGAIPNPRFPDQKLYPHTPKPTLESVLAWAKKTSPTIQFNIETKMTAPSPELVADPKHFATKVLELLKKYELVDRTILQSFDPRTLVEAKKIEPKLRLSYLFETEKNYCELTSTLGAQIASPAYQLVTKENVALCHSKGIEVHPWTANAEQEWQRLIQCKVDGIITDYPKKLLAFLGR
jgi:glycerophosphoryl diester phosphodiesterase